MTTRAARAAGLLCSLLVVAFSLVLPHTTPPGTLTSIPAMHNPLPTPKCIGRILYSHAVRGPLPPTPPAEFPEELAFAFTRCGAVPTERMFINSRRTGARPEQGRPAFVDAITAARRWLDSVVPVPDHPTLGWLPEAVRKHQSSFSTAESSTRSINALVVGSATPAVEGLLLAAGVAAVVVSEFSPPVYSHPRVKVITPTELESPVYK